MKKIATMFITAIITTFLSMICSIIVSAEATAITDLPNTNNFVMDLVDYSSVLSSADINSDEEINILDLITCKEEGTSGERLFVEDVLFGKEISKQCYDLDSFKVNPNTTQALDKIFDDNDRPMDAYIIDNFNEESPIIVEFYNHEDKILKRFKLENKYNAEDKANKYKECIFKSKLPWTDETMLVCDISINNQGKLGWSNDSFMSYELNVIHKVDEMDATISNIALVKSILGGWDYDSEFCIKNGNIVEWHLNNNTRELVLRTENSDVQIKKWFFKISHIDYMGNRETYIFGATEEGKLNLNYEIG